MDVRVITCICLSSYVLLPSPFKLCRNTYRLHPGINGRSLNKAKQRCVEVGCGGICGEKGPAVAASYLFVVFFNILRIERLVVSERTAGRFEEEEGKRKKEK